MNIELVGIPVSTKCNLKCSHCRRQFGLSFSNSDEFMSFEQASKDINIFENDFDSLIESKERCGWIKEWQKGDGFSFCGKCPIAYGLI